MNHELAVILTLIFYSLVFCIAYYFTSKTKEHRKMMKECIVSLIVVAIFYITIEVITL